MVVRTIEEKQVDLLFHAMADATRRDIVMRTMTDDYSVSGLARCYSMSFAAVQKHVAVLERAGFVNKHRNGREQLVRGNPATISAASDLLDELEQLWRHRVDKMTEILGEPISGEQHAGDQRT